MDKSDLTLLTRHPAGQHLIPEMSPVSTGYTTTNSPNSHSSIFTVPAMTP